MTNRLLDIKGLKKYFTVKKNIFLNDVSYIKAVDNVDMYIDKGEVLGLIGESGSGKTTLGRCALKIQNATNGEIFFYDEEGKAPLNVNTLNRKGLKDYRKKAQMIFQNPYGCLNPRMTVMDIVGEPLIIHKIAKGSEYEDRVSDAITRVGLQRDQLLRYPHSFSGGQRQRIAIARAIILNPKLIVCDEAVSALDVSIQAQILNLLKDLQEELNMTYLFITHDMNVVRYMCSRVAIMYCGNIMELSDADGFFSNPVHPYSVSLISVIPKMDPRRLITNPITGDIPDPANPPSGCVFHTRCRYYKDICKQSVPHLTEVAPGRFVKCHLCKEFYQKEKGVEIN